MTLSLRPPQFAEIDLVKSWLPFPFSCPGSLLCLVAVEEGACQGAATLNALEVEGQLVGGLAIFVTPEHRRQGVGAALLAAALGLARETNMQRVATLDYVDQDSELCPFLERFGMARKEALTTYELSLPDALAGLEVRYAALQPYFARGHGPTIEAVRSLADVAPQRVLDFIREAGRGAIGSNLTKLTSEVFRSTSTVLLEQDTVQGILLAGIEGSLSYLDLLLVAENKRRSTAELVLLLEAARRQHEIGVQRVRFDANPEAHPFPVELGRKLQAQPVAQRLTFSIAINPSTAHSRSI